MCVCKAISLYSADTAVAHCFLSLLLQIIEQRHSFKGNELFRFSIEKVRDGQGVDVNLLLVPQNQNC